MVAVAVVVVVVVNGPNMNKGEHEINNKTNNETKKHRMIIVLLVIAHSRDIYYTTHILILSWRRIS